LTTFVTGLILEVAASANAQVPVDEPTCGIRQLGRCVKELGEDEIGVFTSPLRLRPKDAFWLAPLGVATGLAVTYDPGAAQTVE
jgi:hypothetical protein